jgi:hypothetical protein
MGGNYFLNSRIFPGTEEIHIFQLEGLFECNQHRLKKKDRRLQGWL